MLARTALLALLAIHCLARAQLPPVVAARLVDSGIPDTAVGVIVQRLEDGETVLAHGADRSLAPARP